MSIAKVSVPLERLGYSEELNSLDIRKPARFLCLDKGVEVLNRLFSLLYLLAFCLEYITASFCVLVSTIWLVLTFFRLLNGDGKDGGGPWVSTVASKELPTAAPKNVKEIY